MLVQVGSLREAQATIFDGAEKWFLFSVDHQMVEEIVPLPENFAAVSVNANEQPDDAPRVRHPVLENEVVFRGRDELYDPDLVE